MWRFVVERQFKIKAEDTYHSNNRKAKEEGQNKAFIDARPHVHGERQTKVSVINQ